MKEKATSGGAKEVKREAMHHGSKKVKKKASLSVLKKGEKESMLAACHGDNVKIEEGATEDNMDPTRPFLVLKKFDLEKVNEVW